MYLSSLLLCCGGSSRGRCGDAGRCTCAVSVGRRVVSAVQHVSGVCMDVVCVCLGLSVCPAMRERGARVVYDAIVLCTAYACVADRAFVRAGVWCMRTCIYASVAYACAYETYVRMRMGMGRCVLYDAY